MGKTIITNTETKEQVYPKKTMIKKHYNITEEQDKKVKKLSKKSGESESLIIRNMINEYE